MERVDFTAATLWYVDFTNDCDLSTVKPPADGLHRLYDDWKARLEAAGTTMKTWPEKDRKQGKDFIEIHWSHAQNQPSYILNSAQLVESYGSGLASRILATLEAQP